jgi:hypothetical protein
MDINANITLLVPKTSAQEAPQAVKAVSNLPKIAAPDNVKPDNIVLPFGDKAIKELIDNGEAKLKEAFTTEKSTFTIFKLPDGKFYSRVRDLNTGDVKYFPTIDSNSYRKAVEAMKGNLYEAQI